MCWKTSVQPESHKHWFPDCVPVREAPFVVPHTEEPYLHGAAFLRNWVVSRLKGGCGQDWPPHISDQSYD